MAAGIDLATLSLNVNSESVDQASESLNRLGNAADVASRQTQQITGFMTAQQIAAARAAVASANFGQAVQNVGKQMALTGQQATFLSYQINDVVTSLASGISPMTVLAQQGGQVYQILSSGPNGVGGSLRAIGQQLSGMITPARVAIGGFLAVAAAAGIIYNNWRDAQLQIQSALTGVGERSGVTVSQINEISETLARQRTTTVGFARDIASSLAGSGNIRGADTISAITNQARNVRRAFNLDTEETAKLLTESFSNPIKGAETLNQRLGFLDARTRDYIRTLQQQGRLQEAQNALVDAFSGSAQRAAENVSFWARSWDLVSSSASRAANAIGEAIDRAFGNVPLEEQRNRLQAEINRPNSGLGDTFAGSNFRILQLQQQLQEIDRQIAERERLTRESQQRAASVRLQTLLESLDPTIERTKLLRDQIEEIQRLLAEGGSFNIDTDRAQETILQLRRQLRERNLEQTFGGPVGLRTFRDNAFQLQIEGASEFTRKLEDINRQYDEYIRHARTSAEIDTFRNERGVALGLAQREYLRQPTQFRRSVLDAPEQYREFFLRYGAQFGVDPNLLASQAFVESRFNPNAVSRAGARGISQFIPSTARQYGVDVTDPESSIRGQAQFLRDLLRQFNGNVPLALAGYNAGPGRVQAVGGDISRLPQETQQYIEEILRTKTTTEQAIQTNTEWNRSLEQSGQSYQNNVQFLGRSHFELDRATKAQELMNQAIQQGMEITPELTAHINRLAEAHANLAQSSAALALAREAEFEREQIGRTDSDQAIFGRLRGAGIDSNSPAGRFLADQLKLNDALSTTKDLAREAFGGLLQDLRQGATIGEAFSGVLDRLADRLISLAADSAISALFSGIVKSFGGGGGLFGGSGLNLSSVGGYFGGASPSLLSFGGPRERGGSVSPHNWYLVGERRPEIFVPDSPGTILPNVPFSGSMRVENHIHNYGNQQVEQKETETAQGLRIDTFIGRITAEQINRPGTAANRAVRNMGTGVPLIKR